MSNTEVKQTFNDVVERFDMRSITVGEALPHLRAADRAIELTARYFDHCDSMTINDPHSREMDIRVCLRQEARNAVMKCMGLNTMPDQHLGEGDTP